MKGAFFVSADKLKTFDSGTHFDAASQIELGERFAAGMKAHRSSLSRFRGRISRRGCRPLYGLA